METADDNDGVETADDTLHNIPTAPLTNVHVDKEKASVVNKNTHICIPPEAFLVRKVIIFGSVRSSRSCNVRLSVRHGDKSCHLSLLGA